MKSHGDKTPDACCMERWEVYKQSLKMQYFQGFDAGYFANYSPKPKMSEVYSQGYSDGYALAQCHDDFTSKEAGYVR